MFAMAEVCLKRSWSSKTSRTPTIFFQEKLELDAIHINLLIIEVGVKSDGNTWSKVARPSKTWDKNS